MIAHRQMGLSLLHTGKSPMGERISIGRLRSTIWLRIDHLVTRFGQHIGAASLCWRSIACWLLGYPDAALTDTERAMKIAREALIAATLIYVLNFSLGPHLHIGDYLDMANALADELYI